MTYLTDEQLEKMAPHFPVMDLDWVADNVIHDGCGQTIRYCRCPSSEKYPNNKDKSDDR